MGVHVLHLIPKPISESSGSGGQELLSFCLGFLCGGTSVSEKPLIRHPIPLQVSDDGMGRRVGNSKI